MRTTRRTTEVRFGGYQGPESVHTRAAVSFGAALKKRSGGDVDFSLLANVTTSGRQAADLLTLVESGELTACYFSTSYLAARVPEFELLDLPFMIEDRAAAYAALDGPLGRLLADRLEASTSYKLLGFWDNGFRHFSNAVRPLRTPGDCRGLRIRTLFSDLHGRVFSLLGFAPVPLDVKDLLAAIEAGTVDAQENPLTNTYHFGIHEHHRFITLSAHFFGAVAMLCHRPSFDAWPSAAQETVAEAAREATRLQRSLAAAEDDAILEKLTDTGSDIVRLTADERAEFVDAVAPVVEEKHAQFGEESFAFFRKSPA